MSEAQRGRIIELAPIGDDGRCTSCGSIPTRETGRCKCVTGQMTVVALPADPPVSADVDAARVAILLKAAFDAIDTLEAAIRAEALDVERLAHAAANEADSATEDERRDRDIWSLFSERIRDEWRRKAERIAAEYARLAGSRP